MGFDLIVLATNLTSSIAFGNQLCPSRSHTCGYALAYVANELETGAAFVDLALSLNGNVANAWGASA